MKLLRLKMENFKGINSFTLDAQGENVDIYGDNATGKTTLADAFMWLLFDKDSSNRKDFQIKTLRQDGEPEHGLEHSVEAILALEDGKQIALKKVYSEKWTKKRGSATAEFTGHTTDHYLDGVPVKKKEYDEQIAQIADEQIFRLLTDPTFFNVQLHWQKRRELLLEVCGDISDEEVIASEPKLNQLAEVLGNRSIEQHKKVIKERRAEINKELQKIPVRIDEAERNLPDISKIDKPEALDRDISKAKKAIEKKQAEIARIEQGGEMAEKRKALAEIETKILTLRNQYSEKTSEAIGQKRQKMNDLLDQINGFERAIEKTQHSIEIKQDLISEKEAAVQALRDEWYVVNEREFVFEQSDTCPTCGQALPAEQLQAARDKALADFNQSKAEALADINSRGKDLKAEIETLRQEISELDQGITGAKNEKAHLNSQAELLRQDITIIQSSMTDITADPEYKTALKEKEALEAAISELQKGNREVLGKLQGDIYDWQVQLELLERQKRDFETHQKGLARIEELKDQEQDLAKEYEKLEQELYLTEQFTRTKVKLLDDRINSRFQLARFKLFDMLVNGAVDECCETMLNGVPYSNLNSGAKLNVGLDIINVLAEHYGFAPPVWIDNAESVTNILPTKGQQIRLVVSEKDKTLRVEVETEQESLFKEVV